MKYPPIKSIAAAASVAVAITLAGCGGGAVDGNATMPTPGSITVVPSLGKVTNAMANVYKADGATLLGSTDLLSLGRATINFNDYSGPVVIEVVGNANAQYFDEAKGGLVAFPASAKIHAIAPTSSGTVAVTILTELAYQGAVSKSYFPLDASRVTELNSRVRLAMIPEIADLLTVPTVFDASTTTGTLGNTDAGKYALALAALAGLGQSRSAPTLAVLQALTKDIADGHIDGKDAANVSVGAPYANFATELQGKRTAVATSYGTTELTNALLSYPQFATSIDFSGILAGNAGPGGNATGITLTGGNNSAILSGAAIGKGTTAVTELRKQLAVTVLGQHPSLTVGAAFATRSSKSTDTIYTVIPVTNTGGDTLCFVILDNMTYRDSTGAVLLADQSGYVSGSVRKLSAPVSTDSCLAPGETGVATGIETNLYAKVAKIEFELTSSTYNSVSVPAAKVIPKSYTFSPTTSGLSIALENVGTVGAVISGGISKWVLLDDSAHPLSWSFAFTPPSSGTVVLPASGTSAITDSFVSYDGTGSKLLVFVDFEDASTLANKAMAKAGAISEGDVCLGPLSVEAFTICQNDARNQRVLAIKAYDQKVTSKQID